MSERVTANETRSAVRRVVTIALALALVIAVGGVVYISTTGSDSGDGYTEFYLTDTTGSAGGYPTDLSTGEAGVFNVGIANKENGKMEYTVAIVSNDTLIERRSASVADGSTWNGEFAVSSEDPGTLNVEVLLFVGDEVGSLDDPYRELRLVVEVTEPPPRTTAATK